MSYGCMRGGIIVMSIKSSVTLEFAIIVEFTVLLYLWGHVVKFGR